MFKIGDFSKLSQVSIRMLRYYDQMNLLHPAKVDPVTNYRLYSATQLPRLQKIITLRDLGFSVQEMQMLLNNWNPTYIQGKLKEKEHEISQHILEEKFKLQKLLDLQENLGVFLTEETTLNSPQVVTIKSIAPFPVLSLRRTLATYYCESKLWEEFSSYIKENNITIAPNAQTLTYYYDEDFKDENVDIEVAVQVDSLNPNIGDLTYHISPSVANMACFLVSGPFSNIGPAYKKFAIWLEDTHKYKMYGPSRQICHKGPWNTKNENDFLVEIQTPVLFL